MRKIDTWHWTIQKIHLNQSSDYENFIILKTNWDLHLKPTGTTMFISKLQSNGKQN